MDFYPALKWRLAVRRRRGLPLNGCEFMRHCGRYMLVHWRARPGDLGAVEVLDQLIVAPRFDAVAERMMRIVERYYDDLDAPVLGLHEGNVKEALSLASGCLRAVSNLFQSCSAPAPVLTEIFEIVRDAVGDLATAAELITATEAETRVRATLLRIDERRRREKCVPQRIFA